MIRGRSREAGMASSMEPTARARSMEWMVSKRVASSAVTWALTSSPPPRDLVTWATSRAKTTAAAGAPPMTEA